MRHRRLVLILLLPSALAAMWWAFGGSEEWQQGPEWVAHGNVFDARGPAAHQPLA